MKIGFISLGCSKNLVDSEKMMGMLKSGHHELVKDCLLYTSLWENPYNDVRFSIQHPTYNEVIPQVFDQFGVAVLQHARQFLIENQQQKPVLIVDEIGRLEQEEKAYLKLLQDSIAKAQNVLGVLKKCEAVSYTHLDVYKRQTEC